MTENFDSDVNTDQTDKLFETMEKVRKVEHQFNKLGLVYKGVPVDNLTPSQITEIKGNQFYGKMGSKNRSTRLETLLTSLL